MRAQLQKTVPVLCQVAQKMLEIFRGAVALIDEIDWVWSLVSTASTRSEQYTSIEFIESLNLKLYAVFKKYIHHES